MNVVHGLMSTQDLATAAGVVVLDLRSGPNGAGRAAFEAGHIPGARHTDYAADGWRATIGGAPGMLPDKAHLAALFARLGLRPDDAIIIAPAGQSANDLAAAARVFWTLEVCGFRPRALLDGGMAAWIAEGRVLVPGPVPVFTAPSAELSWDSTLRAVAGDTLDALTSGTSVLIDGRAASYFRGDEKAAEARAAGHIPGAIHIDYVQNYDAARNRLKPRADLAALFGDVAQDAPVISYCNTGHTAALNWFVLSRVLGRTDVRLYDGSMTEWTQDPARPVTR